MPETPTDRGGRALWDRRRDHDEDPPWGDPELHARFEQAYRDDARAVFESIDVEALGVMLCKRGGSVNGPQPVGFVCGPHLDEAEAVKAWLTGGAS